MKRAVEEARHFIEGVAKRLGVSVYLATVHVKRRHAEEELRASGVKKLSYHKVIRKIKELYPTDNLVTAKDLSILDDKIDEG